LQKFLRCKVAAVLHGTFLVYHWYITAILWFLLCSGSPALPKQSVCSTAMREQAVPPLALLDPLDLVTHIAVTMLIFALPP
jgi:hypothetical protein